MIHVVWLPVWGSEPGLIGAKPNSQPGPAHTANLGVARQPSSTRSITRHSQARSHIRSRRLVPGTLLGFVELSLELDPAC
jgi:hypothetical protein